MKIVTIKLACRDKDAEAQAKAMADASKTTFAIWTDTPVIRSLNRDDLRRLHFDLPTEILTDLKNQGEL